MISSKKALLRKRAETENTLWTYVYRQEQVRDVNPAKFVAYESLITAYCRLLAVIDMRLKGII